MLERYLKSVEKLSGINRSQWTQYEMKKVLEHQANGISVGACVSDIFHK